MNVVTKRAAELGWKYHPDKTIPFYRKDRNKTINRYRGAWGLLIGVSFGKRFPTMTAALDFFESRRKAKKGRGK